MKHHRLLVCLLVAMSASPAIAGAWLQKKHEGMVIGQATYYGTSKFFDVNGEEQPQARFNKYEFQPYAEYGLFDNLTIGGSAYLQRVSQSGTSNIGLADPEIWARTRLWHNDTQVISIQPLVKLGSYFDKDAPPRGGSKSTDFELSALYGRSMHILSDRDYLDTRIGYRTRNRGFSDQWRADISLGLNITPEWQVIPAVRGIYAPDLGESATFSESGDLDYNLLKAEVTTAYQLDASQWVQVSAFQHVMGIQTGSGQGFSIGYGQRF